MATTPTALSPTQLSREEADTHVWEAFCHHSKTFSFAARLLPKSMQLPIATVYMFCRAVDTIADERVVEVGASEALRELEDVRTALDRTLRGHPPDELLWTRLAAVHESITLSTVPLYELIEGATWDLEGRTVETRADLIHYSNLVGGSIGAMMLPFLARSRSDLPALDRPARDLGIAMQITNILRDVGDDHRTLDRVYLPSTLLSTYNIPRHALSGPDLPPGYPHLVEELMQEAETFFEQGMEGIGALPFKVRMGIRSAARMYREILNEVRVQQYDNLNHRAFTSVRRKVLLVAVDAYEFRRKRILTVQPAAST